MHNALSVHTVTLSHNYVYVKQTKSTRKNDEKVTGSNFLKFATRKGYAWIMEKNYLLKCLEICRHRCTITRERKMTKNEAVLAFAPRDTLNGPWDRGE